MGRNNRKTKQDRKRINEADERRHEEIERHRKNLDDQKRRQDRRSR